MWKNNSTYISSFIVLLKISICCYVVIPTMTSHLLLVNSDVKAYAISVSGYPDIISSLGVTLYFDRKIV